MKAPAPPGRRRGRRARGTEGTGARPMLSSAPPGPFTRSGFRMRAAIRAAALTLIVSCTISPAASAQYFGSNKVQYDRFEFQVLPTAHFDVYYYPAEAETSAIAARMA